MPSYKGDKKQALWVSQEKWIIGREGCNGDLDCLLKSYDARINELMSY